MGGACGHWMRTAGLPCGRSAGHEPPHRPAAHDAAPRRRTRSLTARDRAYRSQLGVPGEDPLPAATGATSAVDETPTPRRRQSSRRAPQPVQTRIRTSTAQPSDAETSERTTTARKIVTRFPSTCGACHRRYGKGATLRRIGDSWGHEACAKILAERERIRSGTTFRSQQASTWRRGASPGSTRDRF